MPIGYHYIIGMGIGIITALIVYLNTRPIACDPNTNRKRKEYIEKPDNPCCICQEPMSNSSIQYLPCGHGLHSVCWSKYVRLSSSQTCPKCRVPLHKK